MNQSKFSSKLPCVLTIAGTDPSGGAGVQADIKAISATGSYAASVITALVAQNTQGVQGVYEISTEFIKQQINVVLSDLKVDAIKIGMLHNSQVIHAVFDALALSPNRIIYDPVMVAKDGTQLLDLTTIALLKKKLKNAVFLITPNLFEAEKLLSIKIDTKDQMANAAQALSLQLNAHVLIKGGHLKSIESPDVLFNKEDHRFYWFSGSRIDTKNTHGTGCTFSSAIASYLAQGYSLYESIELAKHYLICAIRSGAEYQIGQGHGPVDHFYFLRSAKEIR